MSEPDVGRAFFVLAAALRGRRPGGPPPPRVLDALLFERARARFLVSPTVAAGTGGHDLPWPAAGVGQPADGEVTAGAASATELHGPTPTASRLEPRRSDRSGEPVRSAAPRLEPSPTFGAAVPPAPAPLRFGQPAVPALQAAPAQAPGATPPPADAPRETRPTAAGTAAGAADGPTRPPETRAPVPLPFPLPATASRTAAEEPDAEPPAGRAAARESYPPTGPPLGAGRGEAGAPAPGAPTGAQSDLPWLAPFVVGSQGRVPVEERPWPFAASAARSAVEVAERVARAVSRAEAPEPRPGRPAGQTTTQLHQPAAPERQLLPAGSLLREVTRDEVVRAIAERMRALVREDRFRLGELR